MLKQTFDIGDNVTYKHPLDGIFEGVSATIPGKVVELGTDLIKVTLIKAEKVAHKGWSSYIFDEHSDKFFASFEELFEEYEGEDDWGIPGWAWATKGEDVSIPAAIDLIEDRIVKLDAEQVYEAEDFIGIDELQVAIDQFNNSNQTKVAYSPDYSKAIVYSEDQA